MSRHRLRPLPDPDLTSYTPRDPWEGMEKPNQAEVGLLIGGAASLFTAIILVWFFVELAALW